MSDKEDKQKSAQSKERVNYYFTLETAMHVVLISKSEMSQNLRSYFLEIEKVYRNK
jgi:phage anti-repressor protein